MDSYVRGMNGSNDGSFAGHVGYEKYRQGLERQQKAEQDRIASRPRRQTAPIVPGPSSKVIAEPRSAIAARNATARSAPVTFLQAAVGIGVAIAVYKGSPDLLTENVFVGLFAIVGLSMTAAAAVPFVIDLALRLLLAALRLTVGIAFLIGLFYVVTTVGDHIAAGTTATDSAAPVSQ